MLRYLQKSKAKKGFTIIELIVVIAIIAVLTAVILPMMSSEKSVINEARSTAADFYAAVQTVMSKYSLYDGALSPAYSKGETDPGILRHYPKMGGNYPYDKDYNVYDPEYPAEASLYMEVWVRNNQIVSVGAVTRAKKNTTSNPGLFTLLQRNASDINTEFARLFEAEVNNRVRLRDGYYYARVDFVPPTNTDGTINTAEINSQTVKVAYTAYLKKGLPIPPPGTTPAELENGNLYFGSDFKLNCDAICGTCAPYLESTGKYVGLKGTKLD